MIDLLKDKSESDFLFIIYNLVVKIYTDCLNNFNRNKIKCIYLTVLINVINQEFPFVNEVFISVAIRKFNFLVPIDIEGVLTKHRLKSMGSDFDWNRHKHFSEMTLFNLKPELEHKFNQLANSKTQKDQYNDLLNKTITEKEFTTFMTRLEVYSVLYFGLIGFKYNESYVNLVHNRLITDGFNITGEKFYFNFFESILEKEIIDPIMGIVLIHSIRLFSDIFTSLDFNKQNSFFKTLKGIQGNCKTIS